MNQPVNASVRNVTLICVGIELTIIAIAFAIYGWDIEAAQAIARFSGRFSLLIFAILFATGVPLRSRILSEYPYTIFAIVHGIHLIELLIYVKLVGRELILYRILGGALAYAMIFAMPLVQLKFTRKQISTRMFLILENTYCYYVWFIFFMAYLPRVTGNHANAGGTFAEHLAFFILTMAILIIRLATIVKMKQRPQPSA